MAARKKKQTKKKAAKKPAAKKKARRGKTHAEAGAMGGRPTLRNDESVVSSLCEHLEEGGSIVGWCRESGVGRRTVLNWMHDDKKLSARIARARERGAELLEDEIQDIADNPSMHESDVSHRKLMIWAREKRLIWNDPAKYGTKVGIGGASGLPALDGQTDAERVERLKEILSGAQAREEEIQEDD